MQDYLTYLKLDRPPITEIRGDNVGGAYYLRPIRVRGNNGPLSACRRNGQRAALKEFYGLTVVRYDFDRDPLMGVRAPKVELKRGLTR